MFGNLLDFVVQQRHRYVKFVQLFVEFYMHLVEEVKVNTKLSTHFFCCLFNAWVSEVLLLLETFREELLIANSFFEGLIH